MGCVSVCLYAYSVGIFWLNASTDPSDYCCEGYDKGNYFVLDGGPYPLTERQIFPTVKDCSALVFRYIQLYLYKLFFVTTIYSISNRCFVKV